MTNEKFFDLYESGEITVKAFGDENGSEIAAFEYNGKYFLRFALRTDAISWNGKKKIVIKNGWIKNFIKEFDTKEQANNYFKKAAKGFQKIA